MVFICNLDKLLTCRSLRYQNIDVGTMLVLSTDLARPVDTLTWKDMYASTWHGFMQRKSGMLALFCVKRLCPERAQ